MSTHKTLEAAARAAGAQFGVTGGAGEWMRWTRPGTVTSQSLGIQGWNEYGQRLVRAGVIIPRDESGTNVQHEERGGVITVTPYSQWRRFAVSFEIVPGKQTHVVP